MVVIDSATTSTNENRANEEYSEWRLFPNGGRSQYEYVTVNEGFQNRDFQTRQQGGGTVSVIDPAVFGRFYDNALIIDNEFTRRALVPLALLITMPVSLTLLLPLDDLPEAAILLLACVLPVIGCICAFWNLHSQGKKHYDKMIALLEFYQPIFRETFGVELGRGTFDLGDGEESSVGYYFRRPRQAAPAATEAVVNEDISHRVHDDCCDEKDDDLRKEEEWHLPAVYVHRLIPGEISVKDKEYDAASLMMKGGLGVDAETWALLQSTHERMIQFRPLMELLGLVSFLSFFVGTFAVTFSQRAWTVALGCWFQPVVFFCVFLPWYSEGYHFPRTCEKVVTRMNEALQQQQQQQPQQDEDGRTAHFLSLEFHKSELPGREGMLGGRYQFVVRRRRQDHEEDGARKEMV